MTVIGGRGSEGPEKMPARGNSALIAAPGGCVLAGNFAERFDVFGETWKGGINHGIGAEGWQNAPAPSTGARAFADQPVIHERIERRVGGRQHFDPESVVERAR